MQLALNNCVVRSWASGDLASMVRHANNRRVWLNLRDRFPHPYTTRDGASFLQRVLGAYPETSFAIAVDGEAVGGIGFMLHQDIERVSAEIGYWLGEAMWGRGICTDAVRAVTAYAVQQHGLTRVYAVPFTHNIASCRVLEKAGYVREGHMRRSAIKDGRICDQYLYGFVPEVSPGE
jgi:RimJ/RimL family protein N-acetyltransferase